MLRSKHRDYIDVTWWSPRRQQCFCISSVNAPCHTCTLTWGLPRYAPFAFSQRKKKGRKRGIFPPKRGIFHLRSAKHSRLRIFNFRRPRPHLQTCRQICFAFYSISIRLNVIKMLFSETQCQHFAKLFFFFKFFSDMRQDREKFFNTSLCFFFLILDLQGFPKLYFLCMVCLFIYLFVFLFTTSTWYLQRL